MDRRHFLRTAGLSGAGIALSPLTAITLDHDWYSNSRLGIRLRRPKGWHFVAVTDFERRIDEQMKRIEDRERLQQLWGSPDQPILVISKYQTPIEGACPTIQVYAESLHYATRDALRDLRFYEWRLRSYHRDYEIEREPALTKIGGIEGATLTYRFTLAEVGRRRYAFRAWDGLVRADNAEFSITMAGATEGIDASDEDFQAVRESIDFFEIA